MEEEFLAHYGIKGMKWGIRRDNPSGKSPKQEAKTLTDAELKKRISRLNLERQYADLVRQTDPREKTLMEKGQEQAVSIVQNAAKQQIQNATGQIFRYGIETVVTTALPQVKPYFKKKK